jgi:preprotein translocase subunit SecG
MAPMHQRTVEASATDVAHIIVTAVLVISIMLFIGLGAGVAGARFRLYSILSNVVIIAFGAWTGTQAPRLAAHLPTPFLGLIERVNIYACMLWIAVYAMVLVQEHKGKPHASGGLGVHPRAA